MGSVAFSQLIWEDARRMSGQEDQGCMSASRDTSDYRRLLRTLLSRAAWLGSRHPEDAAQEALKRSLENSHSQAAVEYYFSEIAPASMKPPEWSLEQLLAWLHGVLYNVVREEYNKASTRREVYSSGIALDNSEENVYLDLVDPAPSALDGLIQRELEKIVVDCFPMLEHDYQAVLKMRVDGRTYKEIARHLGVNENTVATWISRGIRTLAQRVRDRIEYFRPDRPERGGPDV